MKKSDFNFDLPQELIAQSPIENRDKSRLLCLDKVTGEFSHYCFFELPKLLGEGDCLVLNDSRVLPARLFGKTEAGSTVEIVLLREVNENSQNPNFGTDVSNILNVPKIINIPNDSSTSQTWECLTKPGKKAIVGTKIIFGDGELTATVRDVIDGGNRLLEFSFEGIFLEVLEKLGKMPLPPYIHDELDDPERYQTVYSKEIGSAAAPTAGLHFTHELLEEISNKGVHVCYLTLHVGLGTFRPVKTDNIEDHEMHAEYYVISEETAKTINEAKKRKNRITAVGTTSCRVLESCSDETGTISSSSGFTNIFIYPGYKFKCIDSLITNFHLPESTLIMLISALAGRENILNAYKEAIKQKYKFYSFGDAMIVS